MGQFGLGPQTLAAAADPRVASAAEKWKHEYACVPVEGGTAYELRIDGQSVLDSLGMKELPERAGFELYVADQDCPLVLRTEGWGNGGDTAWLFTDEQMAHVLTDQYGSLSLRPQAMPPASRRSRRRWRNSSARIPRRRGSRNRSPRCPPTGWPTWSTGPESEACSSRRSWPRS
jgi:hypothetical protein